MQLEILWSEFFQYMYVSDKYKMCWSKTIGNFLRFNTDCVAEMLFPNGLIEGCRR